MATQYFNPKAIEFYIKERRKFGWNTRGERVVKFGGINYGDSVLDLCCGPGFIAKVIRRKIGKKGEILGIDHSPAFIKYAKKICHFRNVSFRRGDVEELDKYIGNQQFDYVICLASWLWIKNKKQLFLKVNKALKPNGKFIFSLSGENLYHSFTQKFYWEFRKNLKDVIKEKYPKIGLSYFEKLPKLDKIYVKNCISQTIKTGFRLVSVFEVKRQLRISDRLFLYQNPARTEWVGNFTPQKRLQFIKKAIFKTVNKLGRKNNIERHTYYIILQKT